MRNKSTLLLLAGGFAAGIAAVVLFNVTMDYTSTDEFCLSCHNHDIPYAEYRQTLHFSNATGVSPGCADCHLPHEFFPKMVRKVQAGREVFHHFLGTIDTDEKYLEHREEMKAIEIARLKANDSQECRNCHDTGRWDLEAQARHARRAHSRMGADKTCIDCHDGVAHTPADSGS